MCLLIKTTRVWLFLVFLFFLPRIFVRVSLEDRVSLRFENIPETLALELLFFRFDQRVAQKDESTNIQRRF